MSTKLPHTPKQEAPGLWSLKGYFNVTLENINKNKQTQKNKHKFDLAAAETSGEHRRDVLLTPLKGL